MVQIRIICLLLMWCSVTLAVKPPGYVAPPKVHDPNPPKYAYGYNVPAHDDIHQGLQGHNEQRDGINTKGNYYVNFPNGQAQSDVHYIADDWGYHPVVRYTTRNEHSAVSAHFALGQDAVNLYNQELANAQQPLLPHDAAQTLPSSDVLPKLRPNSPPPRINLTDKLLDEIPQQAPASIAILPHFDQPPPAVPVVIQSHFQDPSILEIVNVQSPPQFAISLPHYISPLTTHMYPVQLPYAPQENHLTNEQSPPVEEDLPQSNKKPQNTAIVTNLVAKTQNLVTGKDVLDINQSVDDLNPPVLFTPNLEHEDVVRPATVGQDENYKSASHFNGPIVVNEDNSLNSTIELAPHRSNHGPHTSGKQINIQIIDTTDKNCQEDTFIDAKMIQPYVSVAPTNHANVEPPQLLVTKLSQLESSQLMYSTTSSTAETSSTERFPDEPAIISSTPLSNAFLAPIHAAVRLSYDGKHLENCVDQKEVGKSLVPDKIYATKPIGVTDLKVVLPTVQPNVQLEFGARFEPKKTKSKQYTERPQSHVDVTNSQEVHEGELLDRLTVRTDKPDLVLTSGTLDKHAGTAGESIADEEPVEIQQQILLHYPAEKSVDYTHQIDRSHVQPKIIEQQNSIGRTVQSYPNDQIERVEPSFEFESIPAVNSGDKHLNQIEEKPVENIVLYQQPIISDRPVQAQQVLDQSKQLPVDQIVQQYIYNVNENVEQNQTLNTNGKEPSQSVAANFAHVPNHVPYAVQLPFYNDLKVPYPVYYTLPYQLAAQHNHHYHDPLRSHHEKRILLMHTRQPSYAKLSYQSKSTQPIYATGNSVHIDNHKPYLSYQKEHHHIDQSPNSGPYHYDRPKPVYGVPLLPAIGSQQLPGNEHLFPTRPHQQQIYARNYDYHSNVYRDDYIGPPPLLLARQQQQHQHCPPFGDDSAASGSERSDSSPKNWKRLNAGKKMQWEYGFKPPMVPSIEIDEFGNPIERDENH